jgi:hypothetical protein
MENKQETHEYSLLQHIKFCLECKNESQAIRLIEQYGFDKQEQDNKMYSEEEIKIMYRSLWVGNCFDFDTSYEMETNFEHDFNLWFEQFKKK